MRPYIRLVPLAEAVGALREEYDAAIARAGKVFNVVSAMSLRPNVLRPSMELYRQVMFGPSGLSRAERELLAVTVSRTNDCHYWIRAHLDDLRAEGADEEELLRKPRVAALAAFAEKLTTRPAAVTAADVELLRRHGLDDAAIHDAIQVVAYFNYINRVADGVGIPGEPEWGEPV